MLIVKNLIDANLIESSGFLRLILYPRQDEMILENDTETNTGAKITDDNDGHKN